jgi:transposase
MEVPVLYPSCCGIDVHKKMLVACVIVVRGRDTSREVRTFGTTWSELCRLVQWLQEVDCAQVAMESTGVYWHPVFNALEAHFPVMIVNAQHLKNVPGRKTDIKDAQWIAQCLQLGLLRPSFIPARPQRELRELTRGRKAFIEDQARTTNRIEKVLEGTNSKITSVISDIMGTSGRKMLGALVRGEQDLRKIAQMALGQLRKKEEQLIEALAGNFTEHHRFLLSQLLQQWEEQEAHIRAYDQEIDRRLGDPPSASLHEKSAEAAPEVDPPTSKAPSSQAKARKRSSDAKPLPVNPPKEPEPGYEGFASLIELLDGVTGINLRAAQVIVAECGIDMERFATDKHFASWLGVCPNNQVSAGKRLRAKSGKGNRHARAILVQAAQGVAKSKGTYLRALYERYKGRMGRKQAIMAIAHHLAIIIYHMIKKREAYREAGPERVDERFQEMRKRRALQQLAKLGYDVSLQPAQSA